MRFDNTYCNPLPIPDIPWGRDKWFLHIDGMFTSDTRPEGVPQMPSYRSISDPTVFYWDNKWYLYPSYGMAWDSEDFRTWKHVPTEPECPKYSPGIIPWKDGFLMTSWNCPLYYSQSPLGPFTKLGAFKMPGGSEFVPCDPCLFRDEDGRLYLYAFHSEPIENSRFFSSQIYGWELDGNDPTRIVRGPVAVLKMDTAACPFERFGAANQNPYFGWVEGPHMIRHNGRYYLIYGAPNTQYDTYCMAVAYSDTDPLSEFTRQKRNPLTINRTGLVRGCGHGCVEHGPGNSLWAFYTVAVPYVHIYERRIGMDRVEIDENGEMYCPFGVTDTPHYSPLSPDAGKACGLYPLNVWCRPTASSCAAGRDALYACDGSAFSFWQCAGDDKMPTLTCDLGDPYEVCAARIFWRDIGLDYENGVRPQPVRYVIEGSTEDAPDDWFLLCDRSGSEDELNIDYRTFAEKQCRFVRLRSTGKPAGITPAVIDFTVFGYMD